MRRDKDLWEKILLIVYWALPTQMVPPLEGRLAVTTLGNSQYSRLNDWRPTCTLYRHSSKVSCLIKLWILNGANCFIMKTYEHNIQNLIMSRVNNAHFLKVNRLFLPFSCSSTGNCARTDEEWSVFLFLSPVHRWLFVRLKCSNVFKQCGFWAWRSTSTFCRNKHWPNNPLS